MDDTVIYSKNDFIQYVQRREHVIFKSEYIHILNEILKMVSNIDLFYEIYMIEDNQTECTLFYFNGNKLRIKVVNPDQDLLLDDSRIKSIYTNRSSVVLLNPHVTGAVIDEYDIAIEQIFTLECLLPNAKIRVNNNPWMINLHNYHHILSNHAIVNIQLTKYQRQWMQLIHVLERYPDVLEEIVRLLTN